MPIWQAVYNRIDASHPRSCWDKGVKGFSLQLLDNYAEICRYCANAGEEVTPFTEDTLLNGADNWRAYCEDGGALIFDEDIAHALCTPSRLKSAISGGVSWMDLQVAAHRQAWGLIRRAIRECYICNE